jgi:small subunit ribosomal protein S16
MPVKIRLQRQGRKKRPFYHIVAADSRSPRDGNFIERLGTYNPLTIPATIDIEVDKTIRWMDNGAQPTDTCKRILSFKGVLYKRHLLRGVKKGVLPADQVEVKWNEFLASHTSKVDTKRNEHTEKLDAKRKANQAAKPKAEPIAEIVEEAPAVTEAPAVDAASTEAPATE